MTTNTLHKVKYLVLLALPVFCASTCEKPVNFKVEPAAPEIFISSNFKDESAIEVEVTKRTYDILQEGTEEFVSDAIVSILEGDDFLGQLDIVFPSIPRAKPIYSTSAFLPQNGMEYIIEVEVEGFQTIRAKSIIPSRIEIAEFFVGDIIKTQGQGINSITYDFPVFVAYNDPAEETNYYHLKIAQEIVEFSIIEGDTMPNRSFMNTIKFSGENDNNFVNAYFAGGVLLQDAPFGRQYGFNMKIAINPSFQKLGKLFVELRTVSEDYYRFHNSLDHQDQQAGGTGGFPAPAIPYFNIENGSGIFAGYTQAVDSLQIGR